MSHSGRLLSYWDQRAAVRSKNRNYNDYSAETEPYFFRPNLVPLLSHAIFQNTTEDLVRELQVLQLSRYLFNTEMMETQVINPALLSLQRLDVVKELKLDGYKIYTDEAYHALMSAEVRDKLHRETGVVEVDLPQSTKQQLILQKVHLFPEHLRDIALVFVAAVNETLISANLSQANDARLVSAVREMIADHAQDEAVHHVFFSEVFTQIWPKLDLYDQRLLAPLIALAMRSFLENDAQSLAHDLLRFGYRYEKALEIASQSISSAGDLAQPLTGTIKMLRKAGAFDLVKIHFDK